MLSCFVLTGKLLRFASFWHDAVCQQNGASLHGQSLSLISSDTTSRLRQRYHTFVMASYFASHIRHFREESKTHTVSNNAGYSSPGARILKYIMFVCKTSWNPQGMQSNMFGFLQIWSGFCFKAPVWQYIFIVSTLKV